MDEAAEAVGAHDLAGDRGPGWEGGKGWWSLAETLVRPGPVVVVQELAQNRLQMPPPEDEQVVEAIPAGGPDQHSAIEFPPGGSERSPCDLDGFGPEDLVEGPAELVVAVMEEKLDLDRSVLKSPGKVQACWTTQAAVGWVVTPAR